MWAWALPTSGTGASRGCFCMRSKTSRGGMCARTMWRSRGTSQRFRADRNCGAGKEVTSLAVRTASSATETHRYPFNIVLALALDRLPVLLADGRADDRRRIARLREQWASIRRDIDDPVTAVTAAQWASPPGYGEALQLARLILIGARLDPVSYMGGPGIHLAARGRVGTSVTTNVRRTGQQNRLAPSADGSARNVGTTRRPRGSEALVNC